MCMSVCGLCIYVHVPQEAKRGREREREFIKQWGFNWTLGKADWMESYH